MDKPRIWTKSFTLLTLSNMLYIFGFYMLVPTIPLFVVFKGGTSAEVGYIATSYTVAAIIMRFFVPFALSKMKKTILRKAGIIVCVLVTLLFCFTDKFGPIIVIRMIQGFTFGIESALCSALAADLLPDSRRGEGIGFFGMSSTAMIALAPAIGLVLAENAGFNTIFILSSSGLLLSLVFAFILRIPDELDAKIALTQNFKSLLRNIYEPKLWLQTTLLIFFGFGRSAEISFLSLVAKENGIQLFWIYSLFQAAVSFVGKFITGRSYDKRGPGSSIILGGISLLICLMIISVAKTLPVLLIAGFFSGAGMGALMPAMQTWTMTSLEKERRSVASAAYFNFYDFGLSIGSSALGLLAVRSGYSFSFRTAASSMVVFLLIYLIVSTVKKKKSPV